MAARIVIVQGHPDASLTHFCHALADAYAKGAKAAGHEVTHLDVAEIAPEPLASEADFHTEPGGAMEDARAAIRAADHLVVVFPLWLGGMPARLRAFFEQMARAGFALGEGKSATGWPEARLAGKSAHVVVTMGMPALAYRIWFLNAGVSVLKRLILGISGVNPVRQTTIGGIDGLDEAARRRWLGRMEAAGRAAR